MLLTGDTASSAVYIDCLVDVSSSNTLPCSSIVTVSFLLADNIVTSLRHRHSPLPLLHTIRFGISFTASTGHYPIVTLMTVIQH